VAVISPNAVYVDRGLHSPSPPTRSPIAMFLSSSPITTVSETLDWINAVGMVGVANMLFGRHILHYRERPWSPNHASKLHDAVNLTENAYVGI
jgi:hypothetical protein